MDVWTPWGTSRCILKSVHVLEGSQGITGVTPVHQTGLLKAFKVLTRREPERERGPVASCLPERGPLVAGHTGDAPAGTERRCVGLGPGAVAAPLCGHKWPPTAPCPLVDGGDADARVRVGAGQGHLRLRTGLRLPPPLFITHIERFALWAWALVRTQSCLLWLLLLPLTVLALTGHPSDGSLTHLRAPLPACYRLVPERHLPNTLSWSF